VLESRGAVIEPTLKRDCDAVVYGPGDDRGPVVFLRVGRTWFRVYAIGLSHDEQLQLLEHHTRIDDRTFVARTSWLRE
jgi:hypothetical protein